MACYISTKEVDYLWNAGGGGDGEQTWPHGVSHGLDKPDLIEVRANQSTQVLITTADTCFPAAGGRAAVSEAAPAYRALGGDLQVFEGVWHHGWVLPTREQINGFFCKSLAGGFGGGWKSVGCSNITELDVSRENAAFLEWNDKELQVTSTGQVNTAPECIAQGAKISKTVHNFSADMTAVHETALAAKRKNQTQYLASVISSAPLVSGFIAAPTPRTTGNPASARFLGAQFVVPRPPGCRPGRYIPGCQNPPSNSSASASNEYNRDGALVRAGKTSTPQLQEHDSAASPVGLVERYQVLTEGKCFAIVTLYLPAAVTDMMSPRKKLPLVTWYSSAVAAAGAPPAAAEHFTASGHAFAAVELCGFGTTGPLPSTPGLNSGSYAPEDMANELGRSLPGFHAGEIARVHAYLLSRPDVRKDP